MTKLAPNLVFKDLTFKVQDRKETKTILNSISGHFPSGKLIGILGPSGAGKTTLLNLLSGWDRNSNTGGSIQLNGIETKRSDIKKMSCYITQENYLVNILSVAENLKYAADLKLGRHVSDSTKREIIDNVVKSFHLADNLDTPTGKLSGGQRKRLAICLELLNDPDIVFLDEPTTGLDSVSATQCVKYLRQLSQQGNSVICTIHQPPGNIVKMFDVIYIMANGQCLYQGSADNLITFLADNGVPCGLYESPIDYAIELVSEGRDSTIMQMMINLSNNGKNKVYMSDQISKDIRIKTVLSNDMPNISATPKTSSFQDDWYEFTTIMKRATSVIIRDRFNTYCRMISIIGLNIMTGTVCWNLGADASLIFYNYNMILVHVATITLVYALLTSVTFALNQNIIRNEFENGYYSIYTYYLSSTIMELPLVIFSVTCGSTFLYFLTGQYFTFLRICMFILLSVEAALVASTIGYIMGSLFKLNEAIYLSLFLHVPIKAISGFGLMIKDLPPCFHYLSHLSYVRYTVRSLMGVIIGYDKPEIECPEDRYCHYRNSAKFLDDVGLEDYYFVYDALTLAGFYLILRVLAFIVIRYRLKNGVYKMQFL